MLWSFYLKHHLKAQETQTLNFDTEAVIHKTVEQAYLGLHGDKTMATTAGQSRPFDGPAMEEVIVVFEIPNLQKHEYKLVSSIHLFHNSFYFTTTHQCNYKRPKQYHE